MNSKTKKICALVMALVMMISFMPVFTDEAYADTVITDPNGYLTSGITYRLSFEPGSQYAENVRYYNISTDLNSPSQVRLMINNIKTTNGGSAGSVYFALGYFEHNNEAGEFIPIYIINQIGKIRIIR